MEYCFNSGSKIVVITTLIRSTMFPATNLMSLEPEVFYLNVEVVCAQIQNTLDCLILLDTIPWLQKFNS